MASPFPFTSGQVLTAAQLNSIGEATAFTPSWTGLTPGNATESWSYVRVNDLVFFEGITTLGSTSSVTGTVVINLPVSTGASTPGAMGLIEMRDDDTGQRSLGTIYQSTTSSAFFLYFSVSGSLIARGTTTGTQPWTWATGDTIRASMVYQVT